MPVPLATSQGSREISRRGVDRNPGTGRYHSRGRPTDITCTYACDDSPRHEKRAAPWDNSDSLQDARRDGHLLHRKRELMLADDRATDLSRPVRMLGLLCLRPTASPVGKLRPAGLVLGPGSTPHGSQGACSPGSTRTARLRRGPAALPQDRPLQARKSLLSCDSEQGSVRSTGRTDYFGAEFVVG